MYVKLMDPNATDGQGNYIYEKNDLQASYDHLNWHYVTPEWLFKTGYNFDLDRQRTIGVDPETVTLLDALAQDAMLDMNGKPITQSCKAKESKPKLLEPLFEEREV